MGSAWGGGGMVGDGGVIGAAGAAFAGASFARCSRSIVTPRYEVLLALREAGYP